MMLEILHYLSNRLSGPVAHFGIPAAIAFIFRLNILVAGICGILPDLVDKPLSLLGIGGGRFIGHTLLFAGIIIIPLGIWRWRYGLAAFIGIGSHLALDLQSLIPWFYPFRQYEFGSGLEYGEWLKHYLTLGEIGYEAVVVAAMLAAGVLIWLARRYINKKLEVRRWK